MGTRADADQGGWPSAGDRPFIPEPGDGVVAEPHVTDDLGGVLNVGGACVAQARRCVRQLEGEPSVRMLLSIECGRSTIMSRARTCGCMTARNPVLGAPVPGEALRRAPARDPCSEDSKSGLHDQRGHQARPYGQTARPQTTPGVVTGCTPRQITRPLAVLWRPRWGVLRPDGLRVAAGRMGLSLGQLGFQSTHRAGVDEPGGTDSADRDEEEREPACGFDNPVRRVASAPSAGAPGGRQQASGGVNSEQQQHWFPIPDDWSGQTHLRSPVSARPVLGLPVSAGGDTPAPPRTGSALARLSKGTA